MGVAIVQTVLDFTGGESATTAYVMFYVLDGPDPAPDGTEINVHSIVTVTRTTDGEDGPSITEDDIPRHVSLGNGWGWFGSFASFSSDPTVSEVKHDFDVGGIPITLTWQPGGASQPAYSKPAAPVLTGEEGDGEVTLTLTPYAPQHEGFAGGDMPTYTLFKDGVSAGVFAASEGPGVPIEDVVVDGLVNGLTYTFKVLEGYPYGPVPFHLSGSTYSNALALTPMGEEPPGVIVSIAAKAHRT